MSLRDKTVHVRILTRLDRLQTGNLGDARRVGIVWELRFHFGPGYRIYFGLDRGTIVILLCGGEKSSQETDIQRAQEYWKDYLRRRI